MKASPFLEGRRSPRRTPALRSLRYLIAATLAFAGSAAFVPAAPVSAAPSCAQFEFIGVAGSGELDRAAQQRDSLFMGATAKKLYDHVVDQYKGSQTTIAPYGVRYPAAHWYSYIPIMSRYFASRDKGVEAFLSELRRAAAACPAQQFIVSGYSQGADVITYSMLGLDAELKARIRAVLLFGEPTYNPANSVETQFNRPGGTGIVGPRPVDPDDLQARTRSFCLPRDIVCRGPASTNHVFAHFGYANSSTEQAAAFLASIEPPSHCPVSAGVWRPDQAVLADPGVQFLSTQWYPIARAEPGYRFAGYVAASRSPEAPFPSIRIDQDSYTTFDFGQNVASSRPVVYALARAVPTGCGTRSALTFRVTRATSTDFVMRGQLTSGGQPVANALIEWQVAPNGTQDFSPYGTFPGATDSHGNFLIRQRGPVKWVISPGTFAMRVAYPGDINRRLTYSPTLTVTVTN